MHTHFKSRFVFVTFYLVFALITSAVLQAQVPVWYHAGYYNPNQSANGPAAVFSFYKAYPTALNTGGLYTVRKTYGYKVKIDVQGNVTGKAYYYNENSYIRKGGFWGLTTTYKKKSRFYDIKGSFTKPPRMKGSQVISSIKVRMPNGGRLTADIASPPPVWEIYYQALTWSFLLSGGAYCYHNKMKIFATLKMPGERPKHLRTFGSGNIGIASFGLNMFPDEFRDPFWGDI
jgi:hypothetical protein